jgi:hypothetical protein
MMKTKLILSLVLITSLLFAAAPAAFPPYPLQVGDTITYRTTNTGGIFMAFFYGYGASCGVAIYVWQGTIWRAYDTLAILPGNTIPEDANLPTLYCVAGYQQVQVSSSSTIHPKARTPDPSRPMTFTPFLVKYGIPVP